MNKLITNLYTKLKSWALFGFKYGKWIGIIWVIGFVVMLPVCFVIGGWQLVVAYIICKITGACPF